MASDFSSECNEAMAILDDEKEEGELSLDDVSSSEEGHINYRCMEKFRDGRLHSHHQAPCEISTRYIGSKFPHKKDAEKGKENHHHHIKDTGHSGDRLTSSTLQEKNDDLIPISSDSDMELVGLPKRVHRAKSNKVKKKKKKRKPHTSVIEKDDESIANEIDDNLTIMNLNSSTSSKENRLLKTHHHHHHHHRSEKSPTYKMKISPRNHKSSLIGIQLSEEKNKSPIQSRSTEAKKRLKKLKTSEKETHKDLINPLYKKIRKRTLPSDIVSSPSTDIHVTSLLKKVRHYGKVGTLEDSQISTKTKDHGSSLKKKLNIFLKPTSENNDDIIQVIEDDSGKKKNENGEEEDDLNILRQKALETKQNKINKNQEEEEIIENSNIEMEVKNNSTEADVTENITNDEEIKGNINNEDDDGDDEDLKLRLIALRSAVFKKHRDRVAKLQKDKETNLPPRCESPFSESFINNISLAEDIDVECPSYSSETAKDSNNSIEDMELDSDIESDIVLEKDNNSQKIINSEKDDFSPSNNINFDEAPYSPTDAVNNELILEAEQLGIDTTDVSFININSKNFSKFGSFLPINNKEKSPPIRNTYSTISNSSSNSDIGFRSLPKNNHDRHNNFERPYSPSDAPVFDPDLTDSLLTPSNNETLNYKNNLGSNNINNNFPLHNQSAKEPEVILIDDDLPETDIDGSPLVPMEKDFNIHYHIPEHLSYQMLQPSYQPLYLNNPHHDIRGIPAFIHNPPVPQSVLRVSQQLQQESKMSREAKEMPIEKLYKNLPVPPMNVEFINEHFNYSQLHPTQKRPIIDLLAMDQLRTTTRDIDNQQTKENLSINCHEEESTINIGKNKKKSKQKRKRSKRNLNEFDETDSESNENIKEIKNSESIKRMKTSTNEIPTINELSNIRYDNKTGECVENNIRMDVEYVVRECTENIVRRDAENILKNNTDNTKKDTDNIVNKDTEKILRKETENKMKSQITSCTEKDETQKNLNVNLESRRNSIDEDEDELRAILLASMGKRTKSPKINKTPTVTKSNEIATNRNIQMPIVTSTPNKSTEIDLLTNEASVKNVPTKEVNSKIVPAKETLAKDLSNKETSAKVSPTKITPKVLSTKILPTKILPVKNLSSKVFLPRVISTKILSTSVLPAKVSSTKILPSKVTPQKVLPTKVASQKISPSKIATQKISPSKLPIAKVVLTKLTPTKVASTKVLPTKTLPNKVLSTKITINNSLAINSVLGKRKATTVPLSSNTQRKLVKKPMIPAMTKVVNNAKRYQNSLLQRKLNLQKAIMTFNAKKLIANKSLRVVNLNNQTSRSISPNVSSANKSERFIINLNSDTESDSESERRNTIVAVTNTSSVEKHPPLTIPTTEFERSVDQFLRDVRKRQETAAATKQSTNSSLAKTLSPSENPTNGKNASATITPLAVRHLPVSQQAEYHRLKQQIVEREKLKLQRTTTSSTNTVIPPDPPAVTESITSTPNIVSSTNISKTPITKSPIDNPSLTNSPDSTLAPQVKPNITIQISNIGASPKKTVTISSPVSNLVEEKPKQQEQEEPTFPKLRILTCEQINLKLFQIQVSQKDEGRKVIVGDINSRINDKQTSLDTQNLDDSVIILSEITSDSRENNSETSVNKRIETETSNVALSKNSTTLACDNNITTTINNTHINTSEKEESISEGQVLKHVKDASKESNSEKSIATKEPIKKSTVKKPIEKESTAKKNLIATKESIPENETTVTKKPITEKESMVGKETIAVEEAIVTKESTVSKPVESENIESNLKDNTDKGSESSGKEKGQQVWDVIKTNVQTEVETVSKLGNEEMKRKLVETEQELVAKRYEVLDDLAEVSKSLRQWELEKDLQSNLTDEVKKLIEQLKQTEEKLQEQKDKVTNMGLKVSTVHEKMNIGRKECFRLSKICTGLGNRVYGQKYKVPESGVQLVNNRLKEVAQHTSQLCKKKNDKRRRISVASNRSSGKESDTSSQMAKLNSNVKNSQGTIQTTNQVTNSHNTTLLQSCYENISSPMERQNSYESIFSYGKGSSASSSSRTHSSSDVVREIDKEDDNAMPDSSKKIINSSSSLSDNVSQSQVKQTIENKKSENNKTVDSSSRMENNESSTCHIGEKSVSNQINDNQKKMKTLRPYVSILDHMKTARNSRLDGILCPYQLMGSCQDADCQYVHHSPSH